ncbi:MAG: type I-C CRISPR-associated protein Cas5, partial [Clostridia bacterium]|nr:type I-C CRISPR-associated protein Cas5 [Clostridia bacterium]
MHNHTNKEFCLDVTGDFACFTRPEMKVERVSYDVITPSSLRSIFEAILWKPAIRYIPTKIEVLNPIKWVSVRRNELSCVASNKKGIFIEENRQQRAGLFLRDVHYRLYAELVFVPPPDRPPVIKPLPDCLVDEYEKKELWPRDENPGKYNAMFERRASKGQCFNQPYLGCREFSCSFRFIEYPSKETKKPIEETRDLSIMLYDMDFKSNNPMFFRAKMESGV